MKNQQILLEPATEKTLPFLKEKVMESFAIAAVERFGENETDRKPHSDELERADRLEKSLFLDNCQVYSFIKKDKIVGGAIVQIDKKARKNKLDLFFIFKEYLNQGLGLAAWEALEQEFPEVLTWELVTPYFEKRNIHFYLNKCGFSIVEYFNEHHPDPNMPVQLAENSYDDGIFRFVKKMK